MFEHHQDILIQSFFKVEEKIYEEVEEFYKFAINSINNVQHQQYGVPNQINQIQLYQNILINQYEPRPIQILKKFLGYIDYGKSSLKNNQKSKSSYYHLFNFFDSPFQYGDTEWFMHDEQIKSEWKQFALCLKKQKHELPRMKNILVSHFQKSLVKKSKRLYQLCLHFLIVILQDQHLEDVLEFSNQMLKFLKMDTKFFKQNRLTISTKAIRINLIKSKCALSTKLCFNYRQKKYKNNFF